MSSFIPRAIDNQTPTKRFLILVLSLLLVSAGAMLRLYDLGGKGLWSDELFSASVALYRDIGGRDQVERFRRTHWQRIEDTDTFWTAKAADQSPPLFDLLAKLSIHLIGPDEFSMRLPSVIASVILLAYLAVRAVRSREREQANSYLLLLFLFAFSAAAIEYAQEARNYSLGLCLTAVLSTLFFDRLQAGLESAPLPGWPEITLLILACHTHYNLIGFCAVLVLVYFFLAWRRRDRPATLRLAVVPLAFLPWLYLSAHTILLTAGGGVGWVPKKMSIWETIYLSLYALYALLGGTFLAAAAALILAYLVSRLLVHANKAPRRPVKDLAILGALTVVCLVIASKIAAMAGMFNPRYLLFLLPLIFLLVVAVTARLVPSIAGTVAVGAILGLTQFPLIRAYYAAPKDGYREAAAWLSPRLDAGSVVVTTWWPNRDYYRFYFDKSGPRLRLVSISSAEEARKICEEIQGVTTVGLVASVYHRDLVEALIAACGQRFSRTESTYKNLLAQHWTRMP